VKQVAGLLGLVAVSLLVWGRVGADASVFETYRGMSDASAVVSLSEDLFIAADDEDNILRIYSRSQPPSAVRQFDLRSFLGSGRSAESDIEGSAAIDSTLFWITSHGNNRKGQEELNRHRLFAITVKTNQGVPMIEPVGRPYTNLVADLLADKSLQPYNLAAALRLPPKTPGALNIEGMASSPEGHLLIGFRNPVPKGQALIVTIVNPLEVISGQRARFASPQLITLGGYGIRSMERWQDGYLIVAGPIDGDGPSRLYQWNGGAKPPEIVRGVDFAGLNPEAISVIEREGSFDLFVLSDDGTRKVNGIEAKKLKNPNQKTFRALAVSIPAQALVNLSQRSRH
jgi:hypothetical protein